MTTIPARFKDVRLSDYRPGNPSQQAAVAACRRFLDGFPGSVEDGTLGRGLLLHGNPGLGKTMLACAVANELHAQGREIFFCTLQAYGRAQKVMWQYQALAEAGDEDAIGEVRGLMNLFHGLLHRRDLLVIDEVGKEHTTNTRWIEDEFDYLVRTRYDNALPTLITTNLKASAFGKVYSRSMGSFIHEAFEIIHILGTDHRRAQG